jgi:hypothetical protein
VLTPEKDESQVAISPGEASHHFSDNLGFSAHLIADPTSTLPLRITPLNKVNFP